MKSVVADWKTRVYCVRIEPVGTAAPDVRLIAHPTDVTMSNGQVYRAANGFDFSGFAANTSFASTSIDLNGILQQGVISQTDLESGIYNNARVKFFATSWATPVEDEEPLKLSFFGKTDFSDDKYRTQLMGAIDVLGQSTGRTYSATCQWKLFDETLDGQVIAEEHSRCRGPRAAPDGPLLASFKVTGTLTSVTSQMQFADSARAEAADWFAYGEIRFTSGPNAGLRATQIKSFAAGALEVHEALFYMPQVGDAYEMIPGCRKRLAEDCVTKYANGINFGGQPHVPAPTVYTEQGRQ